MNVFKIEKAMAGSFSVQRATVVLYIGGQGAASRREPAVVKAGAEQRLVGRRADARLAGTQALGPPY